MESASLLRADEKLTAFLELESAIRACGESSQSRFLQKISSRGTASRLHLRVLDAGVYGSAASIGKERLTIKLTAFLKLEYDELTAGEERCLCRLRAEQQDHAT
jgi:hypothetical protein